MTLTEKLIFLANRAEDGRKFYISTFTNHYFFNEGGFVYTEDDDGFVHETAFKIDTLLDYDFTLKKPIVFTEDERVILRNLPNEFQWIARDETCQGLFVYTLKPTKSEYSWVDSMGGMTNLTGFRHIFQAIQWSDDEPCEFRKYL